MSGIANDSSVPLDTAPPSADPSVVSTEEAAPAAPISGSDGARTLAGLVLEVLGGVRTPGEAAAVLGVSTARYYHLESRALAGLVAGCEPRPRGPQIDYRTRWERERAAVAGLQQEVARLTALLRVAQQTYGVSAMPADRRRQAQAAKRAGKRAKRTPSVRALKARERLDSATSPPRRSRRTPPPESGSGGGASSASSG